MFPLHVFLASLLMPAALVAAAEPALSPAAARELVELEELVNTRLPEEVLRTYGERDSRAYEPLIAECRDLLAHFRETGDATHVSTPRRLSMLHLACLARKPELVRALLAAGADPNLRARETKLQRESDTPLVSCVFNGLPGFPRGDAATCKALIDLLVGAGADITGAPGCEALLKCADDNYNDPQAEEVALHLLRLGANPHLEESPGWAYSALAHSAMPRLLEELLQRGIFKPDDVAEGFNLLGHTLQGPFPYDARDEAFERMAASVAVLLRHGANLHTPCYGSFQNSSAADCIHGRPDLLAYLRRQGLDVPQTPRELHAGKIRAELAGFSTTTYPPAEQIQPHFEEISRLLLDDVQEGENASLREVALRLMVQADARRTSDFITHLPMWQKIAQRNWTDAELALFLTILEVETLRLPADWLCDTARQCEEDGLYRLAHELIHLLERDPQAEPLLKRLSTEAHHPAIQSAAWSARLHLVGIEPLPHTLWRSHGSWARPEAEARVKKIETALKELRAGTDSTPGHFLDFSQAFSRSYSSHTLNSLLSDEWLEAPSEEAAELPQGQPEALLNTLRDFGEEDAADFITRLCQWRREYFLAANDPEAQTRIASSLREYVTSAEGEKHAYTIEAVLARLLWVLRRTPARE